MNSILIILALTITPVAHATDSTAEFLSEIGVPSEIFNENGKALIAQEMAWVNQQANQHADEQTAPQITPHYAPGDEISVHELKILGRGVVDRKTGDSLALTFYTGPSVQYKGHHLDHCTRLRHVLFEAATQKAYYIGHDYLVTCGEEATPILIKQQLKTMNQNFKKFRRSTNHNRNFWILAAGGMAIAPTVWLTSPASWMVATAGGLPRAVGVSAASLVVWGIIVAIYNSHGTLFAHSAGGSTVMMDQNGWNWSSKPNQISARTFELYRQFIDFGHLMAPRNN